MYHRIDATDTDPWGICVSPEHFEEQINYVTKNFNVISTTDLIKQITTGSITDNSICITFDDGYADNYMHARPILEKYSCPATFFISTAFTGRRTPFWWDELEMILLHSKKLPGSLSLYIAGENNQYTLKQNELTAEQWRLHTNWKWYESPPTDRCMLFLQIWEKLRPLFEEEIEKQMVCIRKWAGAQDEVHVHRLPMHEHHLHALTKNQLFTIGMHTHTHPDLQDKEKRFQLEELLTCKTILKAKYEIETNCLAYPYGRYNTDTIKAVEELNIEGCFTTRAGNINAFADPMVLGRYQVFDQDMPGFTDQLASWRQSL